MALRAAVIGGGIGGLAAAVALERVGIAVEVFERAPELREVGAGISLWSNAVRALARLGVAERALARGQTFERAASHDGRGRLLSETRLDELVRAAGAPCLGIHRADLQRSLAEALAPERLHCGRACVGVEAGERSAAALFADGSRVEADLVIGADGIHSAVREALAPAGPPRFAGYGAWRGVAPLAHPALAEGRTLFLMGRGYQSGLLGLGGERTYWFLTRNGPAGERVPEGARRAAALALLRGAPPAWREVVEATPESALLWNDIVDRPPAWVWGRGRATLLGDAIHPTTPNLGQGACMALESAVVLAATLRDHLARGRDPRWALREYEDARRPRTAWVQDTSWAMGRMFRAEAPLACWLRDALTRSPLGRWQAEGIMRRLLLHPLPEL